MYYQFILDNLAFIWSSIILLKMKTYGYTSWQFFFILCSYIYYYYYDYIAGKDEYNKELLDLFSTIRKWNMLTLAYLFGNFCQYFCFRVVVLSCMSLIVFQSKNANCYIPFNTLLFLSSGIKECRTCFVSSFHFIEISGNLS